MAAASARTSIAQDRRPLSPLEVHREGHLLQTSNGAAFFWLGDTAWRLVHATNDEEASYYLHTRAAQGFNVVMTTVLDEQDGVRQPSAMGLLPFVDGDPSHPVEAYFDRVVRLVDLAASLGLYMALLPTWGDKLTAPWGAGPRLFTRENVNVPRAYAAYLSALLRERSNVIWMLGGDRPARFTPSAHGPLPEPEDWTPVWAAMAESIAAHAERTPLILYHPQGGEQSTSAFLHDANWLSINGMQSGHGSGYDVPVWDWIARDYALVPSKPTLDLEPNYEDHPYNPWPAWDPATGFFRDAEVRRQMYRSVFAGGCGATYGHHAVWQFANKRNGVINHADRDWTDALQRPAGRQAVHLRHLIESRPFFSRVPAPEAVERHDDRGSQAAATRDARGSFLMVYVPRSSQTLTVRLDGLRAAKRRGWWFSPVNGTAFAAEGTWHEPAVSITSPPHGPDWVLVVEDSAAGFPPPGLPRASS